MATSVNELYSRVVRRMWRSGSFRRLSPIPPCGQGLWLYLLTTPEATAIPGTVVSGEAGMAEALGWPLKPFREAFAEAFAEGMVKADWKARLVWLPNALELNPPPNPNVLKSWAGHFEMLPDCDLKYEVFRDLKSFTEGLGKPFAEAFREAFREPFNDREREREREREPFLSGKVVGAQPPPPEPTDPIPWQKLRAAWNEATTEINGQHGLKRQPLSAITESRKKHLRARIAEHGIDAAFVVMRARAGSRFLAGVDGDESWRRRRGASFDWCLQANNFAKIIEGKYEDDDDLPPDQPPAKDQFGWSREERGLPA